VRGGEELARHVDALALGEPDEERQVGVTSDVVVKHRSLLVDEKFLEDDVTHGHRQRAVRTGVRGEPLVGELGVVGIVRRDHDYLLPPVAGLGHEVRIRGPGDGHVGAPHHQVGGVPPVRGLRIVGLVTEDLR